MEESPKLRLDQRISLAFLQLLARLPLRWFHRVGSLVGWLMYWGSPTYAKRLSVNIQKSGTWEDELRFRVLRNESVQEMGKMALESVKIWFAPHSQICRVPVECRGWTVVEEACGHGRGIIFLLPHLGSIQFAMKYVAGRFPLTALYRPPRRRWFQPFLMAGSGRARLSLAATNVKGVGKLSRALRRGEAIALFPDQAPNSQGGVWADFFGRPAYTTTLPKKLQRATGAAVIGAFAERLPDGRGYRVEFQSVPTENFDEAVMNHVVECLVRRCPGQYLWSYNRYKIPRKVVTTAPKINNS